MMPLAPGFLGQPREGAAWCPQVSSLWPRKEGVTHVGSAALLIIGYGKTCLHFQSSGMCIYDYVANPLIFDLDTKTFGC